MVQAQSNPEMLFRKWQQHKSSKSQVWAELQGQGWSTDDITTAWNNYNRYRLARRITQGWVLMGVGGFLGLVSCILTMLDIIPAFRGVLMYGLTSFAVSMAFYGCYLVMEKPADEDA